MTSRQFVLIALLCLARPLFAQEVKVSDLEALKQAVAAAKPGTTILIAAGQYDGGLYFENLHGAEGKPIVIAGADRQAPPQFVGKTEAFHFSDVSYLTLRDLCFSGQTGNGLNLDDGGSFDTPSHHVVLERLKVSDIGPKDNHDGLKLSGLDDFRISGCTLERWGEGGSGIDMVGCHRGLIENCSFTATPQTSGSAVQNKGGTSDIVIRRNHFERCGQRSINIGGSTGLEFFRPRPEGFEARNITVEGNLFIGSFAPVAFVGVDGATVRFNTMIYPGKWALRILQETTSAGFVPCRNGVFTRNLIVFRSNKWTEGGCNIGPNTAPETFQFAQNAWYCDDKPDRSKPTLPTEEVEGVYSVQPVFSDEDEGDFDQTDESPLTEYGCGALPQGR